MDPGLCIPLPYGSVVIGLCFTWSYFSFEKEVTELQIYIVSKNCLQKV